MRVVCAWCQAQGVPDRLGEAALLEDANETHGICLTHRLQMLREIHSRLDRFYVIVARNEPDYFTRVSEELVNDPRVQVLMDRRRGERRHRTEVHEPNLRRSERRSPAGYLDDIRYHPVVIMPPRGDVLALEADGAPESPSPVAGAVPDGTAAPPVLSTSDAGAARDTGDGRAEASNPRATPDAAGALHLVDVRRELRQQLDRWIEEGQDLAGRVIPRLVRDCDALWERAGAAEQEARRLRCEAEEARAEVTTLRAHRDQLRQERASLADALQRCVTQMGRLAGDVLGKLEVG
jgi:hypothetical protein